MLTQEEFIQRQQQLFGLGFDLSSDGFIECAKFLNADLSYGKFSIGCGLAITVDEHGTPCCGKPISEEHSLSPRYSLIALEELEYRSAANKRRIIPPVKPSLDIKRTKKPSHRTLGQAPTHVYVMSDGLVVKVGFSRDPVKRYGQILARTNKAAKTPENVNWSKFQLIAHQPETVTCFEKLIHDALPVEDHIIGEYWRLTPRVAQILSEFGLGG